MARAAPWLVLLFVSLMASGSFVMIKYLNGFVTPVELFLLRFFPASVAAITLILLFYRKAFMEIAPRFWWYFLGREFIAVMGFHFTLIYAESVLPAGASAMVVGAWPVMTIFIAWPILGESLSKRKIGGALLAFAGVALVVLVGADKEASFYGIAPSTWIRYSLILLIAPLSAAIVTVISRWYLNRDDGSDLPDSIVFALLCRAPSGLFAMLLYLIFKPSEPLTVTLTGLPNLFWILVAVLSMYNTLFGFWLFNWALQRIEAGNVASFNYIQTLFALLIAWIFLEEPLNWVKVAGAIAIVAGVLITNLGRWPIMRPRGRIQLSPPDT
jgi:drug/metabolite transporter (DMT)-like permease